jgi:hypothetical protein
MKTVICLIALALAAPAVAEPVIVRTGAGLVVRTPHAELKTVAGRASFLSSVEASAGRLCRDVHPRSDRAACAEVVLAGIRQQALPSVRQALELAAAERSGILLASR